MVEEYEEIADSQYPSERLEYLDEDYGELVTSCSTSFSTLVANHLFTLQQTEEERAQTYS